MKQNPNLRRYVFKLKDQDKNQVVATVATVIWELLDSHEHQHGLSNQTRQLVSEVHECIVDSRHLSCLKHPEVEQRTLFTIFNDASDFILAEKLCSRKSDASYAVIALCMGDIYDEVLFEKFIENVVEQLKKELNYVNRLAYQQPVPAY